MTHLRMTHTVALLEVSQATYDEIAEKLRAAGYEHAFMDEKDFPVIDMQGIGLAPAPQKPALRRPPDVTEAMLARLKERQAQPETIVPVEREAEDDTEEGEGG